MKNDEYILFEHNLTLRDSKNLLFFMIYLFGLLCFFYVILMFNIGSILQTQPILVKNLSCFNIVIGIFFVIICILIRTSTFAKIILTEDKIIYKPPVSVRVYEMNYSGVKSFFYSKSTLFVIGNFQQQFAVNLAKDTADKIMCILNDKIYQDK